MKETTKEIREQFADVRYVLSNSRADYYQVGAADTVTVSARHASGRYVCHKHNVNDCEHTKRVEAFEKIFGTPGERALVGGPTVDGTDDELPSVDLLPDFT